MKLRDHDRRRGPAVLAALLILGLGAGAAAAAELEVRFAPWQGGADRAEPPLPPTDVYPIQLVLDDDTPDGSLGIDQGTAARQFLWFNAFVQPAAEYTIDEVWVLFPAGAGVAAGDAIQLVVYLDPDSDPTNGAQLLATIDETVQAVDGDTFSVFTLAAPVTIDQDGDVLVGVINRFVESGVTPPGTPAALDDTASQGQSWLAVWAADPPIPPDLPADTLMSPVDAFYPGNWMIRAFGQERQPLHRFVPALGGLGVGALIAMLCLAGAWRLWRR